MQIDTSKLNDCLNKLDPDASHDEWFNILTAFKSAGGSFEQFDRWSSYATRKSSDGRPVYCQRDCKVAWDSVKKSGNQDGAFGTLCKLAGTGTFINEQVATGVHDQTIAIEPEYIDRCAGNVEKAIEYFCGERKLSEDCVKKYRLGFDAEKNAAVIPYPGESYYVRRLLGNANGQRYENPQGKKPVFNANALKQSDRPVWVLEGQIDALSILDCGGEACTGLNEKATLEKLLENSDVTGFILAGDSDRAGQKKNDEFAEILDEKQIPYSMAELPDGFKDVNEMLTAKGHDAVTHWIESEEKFVIEQNAMKNLKSLYDEYHGKEDPNEVIKKRFLCKGSGMFLVAESGVGKSSLIMQMAMLWSLGQPAFKLPPKKKLNILIIQAENDDFDIVEEIEGIRRGAVNTSEYELEENDIDDAMTRINIISNASQSGDRFAEFLHRQIKADRKRRDLDLVIIDPLSAYVGCDLNLQKDVSHFLRNRINPILKREKVALIIVHHTTKPLKTNDSNANFNDSYAGAGSAELTNWARAIIMLKKPHNVEANGENLFQMTAPKRGWSRLEWENNEIWLKWAKGGGIFWETAEKPKVTTVADLPNGNSAKKKDERRENDNKELLDDKARQILGLFKSGEALSTAQLEDRMIANRITTNKNKRSEYIKYCSANHLLSVRGPLENEKDPTTGKKYPSNTNLYSLIETPEQQILEFIGDGSCSSDSIYSHVEDSAIFSPAQVEEALNKCVTTGVLQRNGDVYCKPQKK